MKAIKVYLDKDIYELPDGKLLAMQGEDWGIVFSPGPLIFWGFFIDCSRWDDEM